MRSKTFILTILLIAVCVMPSLSACRANLSGTETAVAFLESICKKDFKAAYELSHTDYNEEDFIGLYNNLFDTLDVTSVEFQNTECFETEIYSSYNYTLTYKTRDFGDITDNYSMTVRLDDQKRHYVDWSAALILPEMEDGDSIYKACINAKRGDIIADHTILAENVPLTTVSVQTEDFTDDKISANIKIISDILGLEYDEEIEKVKYNIILTVKDDPSNSDSVQKSDFEKQLSNNIALLSEKLSIPESDIQILVDNCKENTVNVASYMPNELKAETIELLSSQNGIKVKSNIYNGFSLIAEYSPIRADEAALNRLKNYEGITVKESSFSATRYYPNGSLLAHTIGYTYSMEADTADAEVKRLNEGRTETDGLYTRNSITGRNGIEQAYETELRGKDGFKIYLRSSSGGNKRTLYEQAAEDGLDVCLTIDFELQEKAEALLENTLYGTDTAGAVIVMNPQNGEIQAMASYPSYDLNLFASGITEDELNAYMEMNSPFMNRATQGRYAPGSVYKPITGAAALENDVLSVNYVFDGEIIDDTWKIPEKYGSTSATDRIKRTHINRRNSPLNMRNALVHSDNIYFANAALMLGDERMEAYWNKLKMNEKVDFEIPVSSSQFKNADSEDRTIIQVAETGFGQGTMLVTPLQIAGVYCAFANGGDIPTPHIVEGLYKDEGNSYIAVKKTEKTYWKENAVDKYVCEKMTTMLKDVVSPLYNGTGQNLNVKSCTVAGKTGTAEVSKGVKDNSWFIGYRTDVSSEDERLVLVVLEVPTEEKYTTLKFNIARNLLELDDAN